MSCCFCVVLYTEKDEITEALPWSWADTGKFGPQEEPIILQDYRYRTLLEIIKRDLLTAHTMFLQGVLDTENSVLLFLLSTIMLSKIFHLSPPCFITVQLSFTLCQESMRIREFKIPHMGRILGTYWGTSRRDVSRGLASGTSPPVCTRILHGNQFKSQGPHFWSTN